MTGFFLIKTRNFANNPIIAIYSIGVDALPLEPVNLIKKQAIGARKGLRIVHLPEQEKQPVFWFGRYDPDPLFMQILQEFSIEQGSIYT